MKEKHLYLNSFGIINTLHLKGNRNNIYTSELINFLEKLLNVIFNLLDLPRVSALTLEENDQFN